mgnify:CR=1 FL=1
MFLCLCFFAVLAMLPGPFSMREIVHNVYRQFPFYYFTEEKAQETWMEMDGVTLAEIGKRNGAYLEEVAENERNLREENAKKSKEANLEKNSSVSEESKKINNTDKIENKDNSEMSEIIENSENHLNSETQPANTLPQSNIVLPHPILDLSRDKLSDYDYLMNNFYIVDENTDASAVKINAAEFLAEDFSLSHGPLEPQFLINHSPSQETFSDSREGEEEDTIVGVGNYLTSLLSEKYGYQVIHIKEAFDMMSGELDRNKAYNYACDYVEKVLEENPSVEVVIDLHRDGVADTTHLLTNIDGKDMARVMLFNGLSYSKVNGDIAYLNNPYRDDNLAMSLQMQLLGEAYYPGYLRNIYVNAYRYCLHKRGRSMLIEAGAQTNTVGEVKNAMEPLADILNKCLSGEKMIN